MVSAGTVSTSPIPNTTLAGRIAVTKLAPRVARSNMAIPAAASKAPAVIGMRGPMAPASFPV